MPFENTVKDNAIETDSSEVEESEGAELDKDDSNWAKDLEETEKGAEKGGNNEIM